MRKVILSSFAFSVLGLFLVYAFSPEMKYEDKSIFEVIEECNGLYKTEGRLAKTFYSKKGNFIGVLGEEKYTLMVMLDNNSYFAGDMILVKGRASRLSKTCWFFPDAVDLL